MLTVLGSCAGTFALVNMNGGEWVVAGVAAAFVLLLVVVFVDLERRERRRSAGLCLTCGYDLRASPGRCPECGGSPR